MSHVPLPGEPDDNPAAVLPAAPPRHREYAVFSDRCWPDSFSGVFFGAFSRYATGSDELDDIARHFIGLQDVPPGDRIWVPVIPEAEAE